jgi:peptide/nickel transport system permease protein
MSNRDSKRSAQLDELLSSADVKNPDVASTRRERLFRSLDRYVYAPVAVAYSDWRTRLGVILIAGFILLGTVGVHFIDPAGLNEVERYMDPFQSLDAPLGADRLGQPIHSQIVHATPAMLQMALAGVLFSVVVALSIGVVAGYKGGVVDSLLMTVTDILMVIPGLPLIVVIAAIWQPEHPFVVGAILAIDAWPGLARMLRSQVLTIRERSYIESHRAMGRNTSSIVLSDIAPQLMPFVLINAAEAARRVIFASVALYFLGFLPFSSQNWGVIMNLAYKHGAALSNPELAGHWLYGPMAAVMLFSFGLILLSQGMDRVFNPRLRARHAKTVVETDEYQE